MTKEKHFKSMDGNTAAAYTSYAFVDVAAIFPITPSSDMAQHIDEWATEGRKNIFGEIPKVLEMQSEKGASGAVHGSLQAGALTSTYTSSQGLMLMIPNMFKIAGELLPGVFHIASRLVASNGLGIFCDHSDVMATRSTGFALLSAASVQQAMDMAAIAPLSAIKGRVPFLHFFDGFRTSHEIQKVELLDYNDLKKLIDMNAVAAFRRNSLNPDHPHVRGTVQNADIHFQQREVINHYWQELPDIVEYYMDEIERITGRRYHLFDYYGSPDAERIIICMGSMSQTAEEVVDQLTEKGEKVGLVTVHLYRPFSLKYFFKSIPKTVKVITVLDRVKEINAQSEPLYMDIKTAFYNADIHPVIIGGRIGVGGKDIRPSHINDVYENMKKIVPKDHFTVGIIDDINGTGLPHDEDGIKIKHPEITECKFWGLGSDGTVGANKSAVKIIGDNTDKYAQAYFAYDSKKSGGITVSHLRFGDIPIRLTYLIDQADYVSCSQQSYVNKYNVLDGLKKGGIFLLNTIWDKNELDKNLPASMKRYIAKNQIQFYSIDAVDIARNIGLGNRTNMIMQSAFFKLSEIIPVEEAIMYLKDSVKTTYGRKGDEVVAKNCQAIDHGATDIVKIDIPASWADAKDDVPADTGSLPEYVKNFLIPVNRLEGDSVPVSQMKNMEDGSYPTGTAAYEKRGVAIRVPHWDAQKCVQCNQCSFVCPHGCIRPILLTVEDKAASPVVLDTKTATGAKEYEFHMGISVLDCTGCENCVNICPVHALDMHLLGEEQAAADAWEYLADLPQKQNPFNRLTVKGSQFEKPLFEFSGACAGCGETPYIKLLTQLFGDRMTVANSAGCAHVFSGSVPVSPYTKDAKGHGPAWNSSLFEDTAEFGLGLFTGTRQIQKQLANAAKRALSLHIDDDLDATLKNWLDNQFISTGTRNRAEALLAAIGKVDNKPEPLIELLDNKDYLVKQSQWLIGGDGWAYDIGYGGFDHVMAQGADINALVLDNEEYANTGGQASKSTPFAAIAKFAASGKMTKKKDLGLMFMSYGYIYVAQIAMGADKAQTLKAIAEAEAYPGPSVVIAYCPCINHGIKTGMNHSQEEQKKAVECGYWSLYRYNPMLLNEGKNPFIMDSKPPKGDFHSFLMNEVRFASLLKVKPDEAENLYKITEDDALKKIAYYEKLANNN